MKPPTLLDGLRRITASETAPYDEMPTRAAVHEWLATLNLPFEVDAFGNTVVRLRRGHPRRQVAFVAHLDHPAFRVESIKGQSVRCRCEGGLPTVGVRGASVIFPRTADGPRKGVVAAIELDAKSDRPRLAAATVRVKGKGPLPAPGDFAVFSLPAFKRSGNRLKLRVADDLAGVAAIITALARLLRATPAVDALALFTRAEEVGFHGALALAIDGRIPRDTLIVSVECSRAYGEIGLGKGPVVRLGDRAGPFDPRATALLQGAAKELGRKKRACQAALMAGGMCEATAFGAFGYAATGIALPLLNYHNQGPRGVAAEEIDLRDLETAVELIATTALRAGAGIEDIDLLRNDLILRSQEGRERLREPVDPITGYPRAARF
jgi:endoglucanase